MVKATAADPSAGPSAARLWLGFPPVLLLALFVGKIFGNTSLRSTYPLASFLQADWGFTDDEMGLGKNYTSSP